jgi:hypothetical protein
VLASLHVAVNIMGKRLGTAHRATGSGLVSERTSDGPHEAHLAISYVYKRKPDLADPVDQHREMLYENAAPLYRACSSQRTYKSPR